MSPVTVCVGVGVNDPTFIPDFGDQIIFALRAAKKLSPRQHGRIAMAVEAILHDVKPPPGSVVAACVIGRSYGLGIAETPAAARLFALRRAAQFNAALQ